MKNMNVCVCLIPLNFSDRNIPKITRIGKKKIMMRNTKWMQRLKNQHFKNQIKDP